MLENEQPVPKPALDGSAGPGAEREDGSQHFVHAQDGALELLHIILFLTEEGHADLAPHSRERERLDVRTGPAGLLSCRCAPPAAGSSVKAGLDRGTSLSLSF